METTVTTLYHKHNLEKFMPFIENEFLNVSNNLFNTVGLQTEEIHIRDDYKNQLSVNYTATYETAQLDFTLKVEITFSTLGSGYKPVNERQLIGHIACIPKMKTGPVQLFYKAKQEIQKSSLVNLVNNHTNAPYEKQLDDLFSPVQDFFKEELEVNFKTIELILENNSEYEPLLKEFKTVREVFLF